MNGSHQPGGDEGQADDTFAIESRILGVGADGWASFRFTFEEPVATVRVESADGSSFTGTADATD